MSKPPPQPKIYHIVPVDRLASIVRDGAVWCDAIMKDKVNPGTTIGISSIKTRRLSLPIRSRPGLKVGECVPFYFCPRSVMLYVIHQGNHPELDYRGGQNPIVHLEADLAEVVAWAESHRRQWAFTLSNAGSSYFEDSCDINELDRIDWDAVRATKWSGQGVPDSHKEGKQAEFLMEHDLPWSLVDRIGVKTEATRQNVINVLANQQHRPRLEIRPDWYY